MTTLDLVNTPYRAFGYGKQADVINVVNVKQSYEIHQMESADGWEGYEWFELYDDNDELVFRSASEERFLEACKRIIDLYSKSPDDIKDLSADELNAKLKLGQSAIEWVPGISKEITGYHIVEEVTIGAKTIAIGYNPSQEGYQMGAWATFWTWERKSNRENVCTGNYYLSKSEAYRDFAERITGAVTIMISLEGMDGKP